MATRSCCCRRTQLSNAIRSYAAEFGLVVAKGLARIESLLEHVAADNGVPAIAKVFVALGTEFRELAPRIAELDAKLMAWHRGNELSRRLREVPTIGPIGACLLPIKVPDPRIFRSGRDFAAWVGLTAKDHSSGGKHKLGGITHAGDETLRAVLVSGATLSSPTCGGAAASRRLGWPPCSSASHPSSLPWHSPTRLPASLGSMVSGQRYDRAPGAAPLTAAT